MPRPSRAIGWSVAISSALMILWELIGLLTSSAAEDLANTLNMMPGGGASATATALTIMRYNRGWSLYTIVYFLYTLAASLLFLRSHPRGRRLLEIACWVGIVNGIVDTAVSMMLWNEMEKALTSLVGPMSVRFLSWNPFGLVLIVAGFFLWLFPTVGLLIYLRRLQKPPQPIVPPVFVERKPPGV